MMTAWRYARLMAFVGLLCGVLYAVGGLFIDLLTVGLNRGTALAFMALVGMPALFGAAGFLGATLVALVAHGVRAAFRRRQL